MKIAFVDVTSTVAFGGVQTAIWELSKCMTRLGHEVHVFGGAGDITPALEGESVTIHRFPFTPRQRFPNFGTRFRKLAERVSFARNAKSAVEAEAFDWIILTKPLDFFWAKWLNRQGKTRFIFMSGGTDFFMADRWFAKSVDAWVACSQFNALQIFQRYKRYPRVMFNGVDVGKFSPLGQKDRAALSARFAIPEDAYLFTFAGRLIGWKGIEIPLRALAEPSLKQQNVHFLVIGNGPDEKRLKALAHELDVTDKVSFIGAIPHAELPDLYGCSDAGIFPSTGDEAFGITIAEAMSCGLPVVATYIGGIPEVVGNEGTCGILFNRGDVQACAEAMLSLINDPVHSREMAMAARERIERLFTWEASTKRLLAAMQSS